MARMRTIKNAIGELRRSDPGTSLTEWALRQLVKQGEISSVRCGVKYLIDMDRLDKYLSEGTTTDMERYESETIEYGKLRRVKV